MNGMNVAITIEKKGEIEAIMRKFKNELSDNVILAKTANAMNRTMSRAISNKQSGINAALKKETNIAPKYMKRIAFVNPKATRDNLYAGIHLKTSSVPVVAFKPTGTDSGVTVSVYKGKNITLGHAFMAKMKSGHEGVFGRGRYAHKKRRSDWKYAKELPAGRGMGNRYTDTKQQTKSGKRKKVEAITEAYTASPFTFAVGQRVSSHVNEFINKQVVIEVERLLKVAADNIAK